jgi:potassium efflux system protein
MKPPEHPFDIRRRVRICLIAAMLCWVTPVGAQLALPAGQPLAAPTPADIEAGRKAVEADTGLAQDVQAKALEYYDRAAESLALTEEAAAKTAALITRIEQGPARVAELRERLDNPRSPTEAAAPAPDSSSEQLQAAVNEIRAALTVARDVLAEKDKALSSLKKSGKAIVEEYVARERSLDKITKEARALPSADIPPALERARQAYLGARQILEQTELDRLRRRNTSYDLLIDLAALERELAVAELTLTEGEREVLEEALQKRREADARASRWEAEAAIAEVAQLPPAVAAVAEETAALKRELVSVIEREKDVNDALRAVTRRYREIREKFQTVRERIATYGASQALGRLLQRRLENLPSPRVQRGFARERRNEIVRVTDRSIEVEEQQLQILDTEARVAAILSSVDPAVEPAQALQRQTIELVRVQRDTLAELDRAYGRYLTRLTVLEAADREVAKTTREFSAFIRKELTWIPDLSPLAPADFTGLPTALGWLLSPANWRQALSDAGRTFTRNPLLSIAALFAIVVAVIGSRLARHRLPELADLTRRIRTDAYSHTVKALGLTIVAASVWPLIFAVAGWQVEADPIGGPFGNAVGSSLMDIVPFVYTLALIHWLTRSDGLGRRHFRWPEGIVVALHTRLGWLAVFLVPAAFIINLSSHAGVVELSYAIGRPVLLLALLMLAAFVWRLFRRSGSFMRYFEEKVPDGWISRLWFLWFPILLGVPVLNFLAAVFGYAHTTTELTGLLIGETGGLLLALLLVRDMSLRWFYVIERRSRFETALRQREEARAGREQREEEAGAAGFDIDIPEVDYRELGEQARAVVRVGVLIGIILSVGTIWGDLLPAIGFLDRIELPFSKIQILEGEEQQLPVTLADLAIGILILAGTFFAAKNLSGLLGFTVLRRLRLDAGGNYAIVTLCQYLIVAIGVVIAFSTIGLQWSKLQWLIAALGVGLGFGLQEIVANFVSGIILLLERPVRIGDIVTVGGADGYVARIQIRATTILTWEKKELIIPNKEFITGQVVNWTLSDSVNRILVNVGIAYGSDVGKALELLEQVAKENEHVLAEPKPVITFEAFGDNALMLYVRCYISALEHRLETITALHEAIYAKFESAGIAIAFPQRDVHLDTSKPLEIRVHQDATQALGLPQSQEGNRGNTET